jgi:kynurenine formamidase
VMDKEFPLEYVKREGMVFDVKDVGNGEIDSEHINIALLRKSMFVAFYSGYGEIHAYGTKEYSTTHPQLSRNLIDILLEKGISIIGIDFAGVRRGAEHTPMDQYCADRGVFIVENLCHLDKIVAGNKEMACIIHTYPIHFSGLSGLPCRVVAEI